MAGQFDKRTAYASVRFSVYNLMEMSKKEGNALDSSIGESLAKGAWVPSPPRRCGGGLCAGARLQRVRGVLTVSV